MRSISNGASFSARPTGDSRDDSICSRETSEVNWTPCRRSRNSSGLEACFWASSSVISPPL